MIHVIQLHNNSIMCVSLVTKSLIKMILVTVNDSLLGYKAILGRFYWLFIRNRIAYAKITK